MSGARRCVLSVEEERHGMAARHGYWDAGAKRWKQASGTASGPPWNPRATIANAEEVRRRIDQEVGAERLEARFALFRSAEAKAVMPGVLLDNYPIEYGMYLCQERTEEVPGLPPGYLARTDAFCDLYLALHKELTGERWRSWQAPMRRAEVNEGRLAHAGSAAGAGVLGVGGR